ncbi:tyrosine-type recombinase/integrase [Mycobacterium sp. SMC-18]|uniref:tyrosine-type recombinase/integrase n=1 Tax=unclassified Mycobacterium TaxID=2642494 RepID=UPI00095D0809|nr:tyrosine-type recombinase/integrase [Mycobacterium sp. ST-F2]OKH78282.1 integrase [Mycobacterium sp. ST-F2]
MTTLTSTPPARTWRDVADQLDDMQRAALTEVERRGIHTAAKLLELAVDMAGDPVDAPRAAARPGPAPRPLPPAWANLIQGYLDAEAGAGHSRATVATRRGQLSQFAHGRQCAPDQVTEATLLRWLGHPDWSIETRRSRRNALVLFFRWAHRAGHLPANPAAELPVVRAAVPAPRPAPDAAWFAALAAADARVRLMLRLAAEAGLRRAEIARLHSRDLVEGFDGWQLRVTGKGGKVRVLPIGDELAGLVAAGAAGHTRGGPVSGWLFPSSDVGAHLTPHYVGKLMARALPDHWSAHTLRHRFASKAFRGSRNLRAVQTLLGHSSVATTERYTAVDADEVRAAMMAAQI